MTKPSDSAGVLAPAGAAVGARVGALAGWVGWSTAAGAAVGVGVGVGPQEVNKSAMAAISVKRVKDGRVIKNCSASARGCHVRAERVTGRGEVASPRRVK